MDHCALMYTYCMLLHEAQRYCNAGGVCYRSAVDWCSSACKVAQLANNDFALRFALRCMCVAETLALQFEESVRTAQLWPISTMIVRTGD